MKKTYLEVFGWGGTILILVSYALLASGIIDNDVRYHGLLLIGSIGVAAISYYKKAWQPMVLNLVFIVFALLAIARILL